MGLPYDDDTHCTGKFRLSAIHPPWSKNSADHHIKLYSRRAPMPTNLVKYEPTDRLSILSRGNR